MVTEDNVIVAVYGEVDGDARDRLHLVVNSASAMHYSIDPSGADLDAALYRLCTAGAAMAYVDAGLSEMADGNMDASPNDDAIAMCVEFARWAKRHDLHCHGDVFEYFE